MSCTQSQTLATGDGTTTQFTFTFEYMKKSDIHVSLYNTTTEEWDEQSRDDWSFAGDTVVEFNTAPPLSDTANIKISRKTSVAELEAEFYPGSAIRAQDLNNNFDQLHMAVQDNDCTVSEFNDVIEEIQDNIQEIEDNPYVLPIASADTLGGIRVGANLSISNEGVLSSTGGGGSSTITFKGTANFTAAAPAAPAVGDLWINTTAGTGAWTGFVGDAVGVNDRAFFNGSDWDLLPIGAGGAGVVSVVAGDNIVVNSTDPANPIVSAPDVLTEAEANAAYMPLNISTLPALPTP